MERRPDRATIATRSMAMSSVPVESLSKKPLPSEEQVAEFHLLGSVAWDDAWALQRRLVYEARGDARPRVTILCCEHPRLLTIGRSGSRAHVRLSDEQIRREQLGVRWVSRGGGCVLHSPGQLCVYPIVALDRVGWSVGEYLRRLQAGVCATLQQCGLHPEVSERQFGVWGRTGLLAAIGVSVQNWVTCHGAFLNVNPSMALSTLIDGVDPGTVGPGRKTTFGCLLAERRLAVRMQNVRAALVASLAESFSCTRHHLYTGHPLLFAKIEKSREPIARAS